jgi:hypothetical protein
MTNTLLEKDFIVYTQKRKEEYKMNLLEVKENIKIVSSDEILNEKILALLKQSNDCFGIGYVEMSKECKECNILSEFEDKRVELKELCQDLTLSKSHPKEIEMKKELEMGTKFCKRCNQTKSLSCFGKNKSRHDGLDCACLSCRRIESNAYYHNHRKKQGKQVCKRSDASVFFNAGLKEFISSFEKVYMDAVKAFSLKSDSRFEKLLVDSFKKNVIPSLMESVPDPFEELNLLKNLVRKKDEAIIEYRTQYDENFEFRKEN